MQIFLDQARRGTRIFSAAPLHASSPADRAHTRPQRSACKAAKPGEAFLLQGLLLRSVVFEDHEYKFPCSVPSLVDTRKQIAYPPHKLKRVVKLLTVLRTWVRRPKATADQGQCSFSVAAPLSSTSQSQSSRTQRLPRLSLLISL